MKKGLPCTPADIKAIQQEARIIPPEVFDVWNAVIAKKALASGMSITITVDEILKALCTELCVTREEVRAKHWLDVEDAYRAQGWNVKYDEPGYTEMGEAAFYFRTK